MTPREHLTAAAAELWELYAEAPRIGGLETLAAVRGTIDSILSKMEELDDELAVA